jgi:hypothetical protein
MRLLIRPEQMSAIQDAAEEKFALRLAAHLLEKYPNSTVKLPDTQSTVAELPKETLHSLVKKSIERARGYGLTQEASIAAFSTVMFEVAPNFDRHNMSKMLLTDENFAPDARLNELLEVLTDKNWEAIQKTYDPEAWFEKPEESESGEEKSEEEK